MEFKSRYKANEDTVVKLTETFSKVRKGGIVYLLPLIDDGCRADFVYRKGIIKATVKTNLKRKEAKEMVRDFLEKKKYVDGAKPDEVISNKDTLL